MKHHEQGTAPDKAKSLKHAKQAQGTLSKVIQMIEGDQYCPEVIQQTHAAIGLLRTLEYTLLKGHLDHCVEHKLHENKKQTIDELLRIYNLSK
ncbi:MAG: metal-sensitive transcriptional regulator [Candidatus Paceibacterota bacterium]|jgi:DNA-binding FrmR family transcriptional regulator